MLQKLRSATAIIGYVSWILVFIISVFFSPQTTNISGYSPIATTISTIFLLINLILYVEIAKRLLGKKASNNLVNYGAIISIVIVYLSLAWGYNFDFYNTKIVDVLAFYAGFMCPLCEMATRPWKSI